MDWTAGGAAGDGAQLQGPESHSELQLPGHPAQASLRSLQLELHGPAGQRDQRPGHGRDSPGTERGGGGAGLTDIVVRRRDRTPSLSSVCLSTLSSWLWVIPTSTGSSSTLRGRSSRSSRPSPGTSWTSR